MRRAIIFLKSLETWNIPSWEEKEFVKSCYSKQISTMYYHVICIKLSAFFDDLDFAINKN